MILSFGRVMGLVKVTPDDRSGFAACLKATSAPIGGRS